MFTRLETEFDLPMFQTGFLGDIDIGDSDGDGLLEIVAIGFQYPEKELINTYVYEFNLDGTITDITEAEGGPFDGIEPPQTEHGREVLFDDFNDDGLDDILVGGHGHDFPPFPGEQNGLYLSRGPGQGFEDVSDQLGGLDFTHAIASGDVNGDGMTELLFGNLNDPGAYVVTVSDDNELDVDSFELPRDWARGTSQFTTVEIADLDGDGRDEIIAGANGNGADSHYILKLEDNDRDWEIIELPPADYFGDGEDIALDTDVVDLNGDDRMDIVLSISDEDPFYVGSGITAYLQQEDGSFVDSTDDLFDLSEFPSDEGWLVWNEFADFDLDGDLDLVATHNFPGQPLLYLQNDLGFFEQTATDEPLANQFGVQNATAIPFDFNYDGVMDIVSVVTRFDVMSFSLHENSTKLPGGRYDGDDSANVFIGSGGKETARGKAGSDLLRGEGNNDRLYGDNGSDQLFGNGSNDRIWGGKGADQIDGGKGSDTALYNDTGAAVKVDLSNNRNSKGAEGDELTSIENLVGSRKSDDLYGDRKANKLDGGKGKDDLRGRDGDDRLIGGSGKDKLQGDEGADILTGGKGNDRFIYTSWKDSRGDDLDVIRDFVSGKDRIDLSKLDANGAEDGVQSFTFIGDAEFSGAAGELRYADGLLEANRNTNLDAELAIEVDQLTSDDLIL